MSRWWILLSIILLIGCAPWAFAEGGAEYSYRFESQRFDISFVEIKVQASGEGEMRYRKRDEDEEIHLPFKLLPATLQRVQSFYDTLRFLDSQESYQANTQLPHLGKITLAASAGGRQREVSFNYSDNRTVMKLVELYRAIDNQQRRVNELQLARQFTPLDLPRQLKNLESEIQHDRIAEPLQVVPLLNDLAVDDTAPLIARNAARKLAEQIKRNSH